MFMAWLDGRVIRTFFFAYFPPHPSHTNICFFFFFRANERLCNVLKSHTKRSGVWGGRGVGSNIFCLHTDALPCLPYSSTFCRGGGAEHGFWGK